jgi:GNAT superfamily N-acetyltransferase
VRQAVGQLEFRPFAEQDFAELEGMILELYREDPEGEPMTREKIDRTVHELSRHPEKGSVIIFIADDAVAGYAILVFYWSNEYGGDVVFIDELYVKPRWRGQGIATRFIEHLVKQPDETTQALALEVTPGNERAYTYYQKLGFIPTRNRQLVKELSSRLCYNLDRL